MKKIKAVIFDLDGTLANTLPLCIEAFKRSVEPLAQRAITDEEIIATFGPSEEGTIMALVPQHYDKGVADYLTFYESMHHICLKPFDGIPELLNALKNKDIRLAMVTGKGKYSTNISLKQFDLGGFFEIIETGSPSGPRKAEGIQLILKHWQDLQHNEIYYVGDVPGDIIASRKAGIPVVAAAWADTAELQKLEQHNPDKIFFTIEDFSKWLLANT